MLKLLFDKKVNLVSLIVIVHVLFSYYYFQTFLSSALGSGLIILLSFFTWKNKFKFWIGFEIKKEEILPIGVFICISTIASWFLIKNICTRQGLEFIPGNFRNLIHTVFYTLNEEIILGALLLKGLKFWKRKTPNWIISVSTAILFSLIHFVFFKWIFKSSGNLSIITLLTLFVIGVFRNNLILRTGHIVYSWALHFVWIYFMLGSSHYKISTDTFLNDFERFEIFLGNPLILIICAGLAIISFMKFKSGERNH